MKRKLKIKDFFDLLLEKKSCYSLLIFLSMSFLFVGCATQEAAPNASLSMSANGINTGSNGSSSSSSTSSNLNLTKTAFSVVGLYINRSSLVASKIPSSVNEIWVSGLGPQNGYEFDSLTTKEKNEIALLKNRNVKIKIVLGDAYYSLIDINFIQNQFILIQSTLEFLRTNKLDGLHFQFSQENMDENFIIYYNELLSEIGNDSYLISARLERFFAPQLSSLLLASFNFIEVWPNTTAFDVLVGNEKYYRLSNWTHVQNVIRYFSDTLKINPSKLLLNTPAFAYRIYKNKSPVTINYVSLFASYPSAVNTDSIVGEDTSFYDLASPASTQKRLLWLKEKTWAGVAIDKLESDAPSPYGYLDLVE